MYITIYEIDETEHPQLVLWDNPEGQGWEGGGKGAHERGDTCILVADSC